MSIPWGDQPEQGPLFHVPGPLLLLNTASVARSKALLHPPFGLQIPARAA